MNALSVQALGGFAGFDSLGYHLAQLDPATQQEIVTRAIMWGVERGVSDWIEGNQWRRERGLGALGQDAAQGAITAGIQAALTPLMPWLGDKLVEMAKPAMQQATDMIGPVIDQKVKEYGPRLAVITGLAAALLSVLGMILVGGYVVKKVA